MNLFATSRRARECASLPTKHQFKMCLEAVQLAYAAHHVLSPAALAAAPCAKSGARGYRLTHRNHPCALWARASPANYAWCVDLARALLAEFYRRRVAALELAGKPTAGADESAIEPHVAWLEAHAPEFAPDAPHELTPFAVVITGERDERACEHAACRYRRYLACDKPAHVVAFPADERVAKRPAWWLEATPTRCWGDGATGPWPSTDARDSLPAPKRARLEF